MASSFLFSLPSLIYRAPHSVHGSAVRGCPGLWLDTPKEVKRYASEQEWDGELEKKKRMRMSRWKMQNEEKKQG